MSFQQCSCGPRGPQSTDNSHFRDLTFWGMPKMSQHIQHHHPQQPQYVHYTGPPGTQLTVAPQDTTRQPQPAPQPQPVQFDQHSPHQQAQQSQQPPSASTSAAAGASPNAPPLVATGDWTKDLVHLAKTAELKYVDKFCVHRFYICRQCQ